jgi:hypothetical protein
MSTVLLAPQPSECIIPATPSWRALSVGNATVVPAHMPPVDSPPPCWLMEWGGGGALHVDVSATTTAALPTTRKRPLPLRPLLCCTVSPGPKLPLPEYQTCPAPDHSRNQQQAARQPAWEATATDRLPFLPQLLLRLPCTSHQLPSVAVCPSVAARTNHK